MNEELVLDAREVDWGHDVTLNRANLALTVADRIDRLVPYGKLVYELQAPRAVAEFDPRRLLETLVSHGVELVLIGGLAGTARGSAYVTLDVDIA